VVLVRGKPDVVQRFQSSQKGETHWPRITKLASVKSSSSPQELLLSSARQLIAITGYMRSYVMAALLYNVVSQIEEDGNALDRRPYVDTPPLVMRYSPDEPSRSRRAGNFGSRTPWSRSWSVLA